MYDVITIGSATVDMFCKTEAELISIEAFGKKEELIAYPVGSKIIISDLESQIGGGGTNTAVCFSRLGLKTGYLGCLGKDNNSKKIIDLLDVEKIDYLGQFDSKNKTGYSVILDSVKDDRTILTFKGANDNFKFNLKKNVKTKWFYLCSMTGKSFDEMKTIVKFAHDNEIKVAFNPSSYIAKLGVEKLNFLKYVDVLIMNKEELFLLNPNNRDDDENAILTGILKMSYLGPKIVVITDGSNYLRAYSEGVYYKIKPKKVKVLETTGAGDAFASTFISGLIKGKTISESLIMGIVNSQSVIKNYGAKNILLNQSKLNKLVKESKYKVLKKNVNG